MSAAVRRKRVENLRFFYTRIYIYIIRDNIKLPTLGFYIRRLRVIRRQRKTTVSNIYDLYNIEAIKKLRGNGDALVIIIIFQFSFTRVPLRSYPLQNRCYIIMYHTRARFVCTV